MDFVLGFMAAMGITMVLIPPLMKAGVRFGIIDVPGGRKAHAQPIPRVGGIAMAAGIGLGMVLAAQIDHRWMALAAGSLILVVFGIWDDRVALGARTKFLGQILAAVAAMTLGGVKIASVTLLERQMLPDWIALPLTLFFLVGVTNAVNLSDGLDGLAGGMILLCLCALAVLSWAVGQPFVIAAALSVAGAVLGFLRFNTHPARVFMGDAGSQLLGFSVAFLSVVLTQDLSSPLSTALPLLLLGMPVIDTAAVMSERIMAGQSPFKADRNHLHFRLLALGFNHVEAVALIYSAQAVLFLEAWYLRYESDLHILWVFAVQAALVIALPRWAQSAGWRRRASASAVEPAPATSSLRAGLAWLRAAERLPVWTQWATALSLAGYVLLVAVAGARADRDTCVLASVVFLAVSAALAFSSQSLVLWCAKAALYVSAALLVYLDDPGSLPAPWRAAEIIALGLMVASVVLWMRQSARRRFELTPLDLLVVIVAVVAPNLAAVAPGARSWGLAAIKLIALFYAIEALGAGGVFRGRWLNWSALSVMGILLLRAL